jgi:hypothetical protein
VFAAKLVFVSHAIPALVDADSRSLPTIHSILLR